MQRDQLSQDLASLKIDRSAKPPGGATARGVAIGMIVVAVLAGIAYFVERASMQRRLDKGALQ